MIYESIMEKCWEIDLHDRPNFTQIETFLLNYEFSFMEVFPKYDKDKFPGEEGRFSIMSDDSYRPNGSDSSIFCPSDHAILIDKKLV